MENPFKLIEARLCNIEAVLCDMKNRQDDMIIDADINKRLLTQKEAAVFLGVSSTTLWRWKRDGKIRSVALGGRRYFLESEILNSLTGSPNLEQEACQNG